MVIIPETTAILFAARAGKVPHVRVRTKRIQGELHPIHANVLEKLHKLLRGLRL